MKSIAGWYGTPVHGANPGFRALQARITSFRALHEAATYPIVLEELLRAMAPHRTVCQQPRRVRSREAEGARLRPMRGLKHDCNASVIIAGHAFVQNLRRGHDELAVEESANRRVAVAFDELAMAI
jgi:hypothetical protein